MVKDRLLEFYGKVSVHGKEEINAKNKGKKIIQKKKPLNLDKQSSQIFSH